MLNYKLFNDVTKIASNGERKGKKKSDFPQYEAAMKELKIEFNELTKKIVSTFNEDHENEILQALGLEKIKNPMPCGYIEMYRDEDKVVLPVNFNSKFLIGPEGAHLNISGISGLAAKTSYSMFLLKAIQEMYHTKTNISRDDSVAFVIFNVKGRDLLAIDEPNKELSKEDKLIYNEMLKLSSEPFEDVKYFNPYAQHSDSKTYKYLQINKRHF